MKKVVVIGGGTGQSALLRGLKQVPDIELTTIVTVADDGGSTGRLRNDLHLPAMGDLRNVMLALSEKEDIMSAMMNYRFDKNAGELAGHNLGNIMISALARKSGDFMQAIDDLSEVLKVKGDVMPSTVKYVTLHAMMTDGTEVIGEHYITEAHKKIDRVFYPEYVPAYNKALTAIREADYIIIGIGSVFTSILPNIVIQDIKEELLKARAHTVYYCNSMTEMGETDGYSLQDHVKALDRHIGQPIIDLVVYASDEIPEEILARYRKEQATVVRPSDEQVSYRILGVPLLDFSSGMVRHDADKVRDSFMKVMEVI